MSNVLLQPAYVLHTRAYRDTSLLLELFTENHGKVSAVARGVKNPRNRLHGLLQAFTPLLISWYGKTELLTLRTVELSGQGRRLSGEALLCGLYLNELLIKTLPRHDAHPALYQAYTQTLQALSENEFHQPALRVFEKKLLAELGYALQLQREKERGLPIDPYGFYYFDPANGFVAHSDKVPTNAAQSVFAGKSLLALHHEDFSETACLQDAKRLLRQALMHVLEYRPIKSRELFFYRIEVENV